MRQNDSFVNMQPLYVGTGNSDTVLTNVISRGERLDLSSVTGFHNVKLIEPWHEFSDTFKNKNIIDLSKLCRQLVNHIESAIKETWNPNIPHIVYMSGGKDSRILSYILKRLSQQEGKDWLGEIRFYCMEEASNMRNPYSASRLFKAVLKDLGWSDIGIIHRPTMIGKEDYIDFDPRLHPNAFTSFDCHLYTSLVSDPTRLKNWSVITGAMGGEALLYPSYNGFTNDRWTDICRYIPRFGYSLAGIHQTFRSAIFPFLYKPYLQTLFQANGSLFVKDQIRDYILTHILGDKRHRYVGHNYNLAISDDRLKYVEKLWNESTFRLDYKTVIDSSALKQHLYDKNDINARLFGLAMAYDSRFGKK